MGGAKWDVFCEHFVYTQSGTRGEFTEHTSDEEQTLTVAYVPFTMYRNQLFSGYNYVNKSLDNNEAMHTPLLLQLKAETDTFY